MSPISMKSSIVLVVLFVFATLSLRAQSADHCTISLAPGDNTEAMVHTSGGTTLQVMLTPEKRAEFTEFTGRNLNKRVRIVVRGKSRAEPLFRERIAVPSMEN